MPHADTGNIVFIDSSAIVGVLNERDQNYEKAIQTYEKLKRRHFKFVLTNYIVAECGLTIGLSKTGTLSVNDCVGHFMVQRCKVVQRLEKPF
jgi:predicted nucleic acid-binding protein